jgi:hypothetical protein
MNLQLELEEGIRVLISNLKRKSELETELWGARKIKEKAQLFFLYCIVCEKDFKYIFFKLEINSIMFI